MKGFFSQHSTVPDSEWKLVSNLLVKRKLKRNEFLIKEDHIYQNEVFIESGLIRGFYVNDDGEDINISFNLAPEVLTPWFSRNINGKSSIN